MSANAQPATPNRHPTHLRRNLAIVLISWGLFGAAWWNAVLGPPYTAYAVRLGATPLTLGLLSAAATLGLAGQLLSAYLIERTGRRKAIFLAADLVQRPLWVLVGAVPFLVGPQHGAWRLALLFALTLLSSLLGSIGSPAWVGWMAHIIPDRVRARFLGVRFRLATVTGMTTALVVGKILDWDSSFHTFFGVFAIAALMGTIDIALFCFVPRRGEAPAPQPPSLSSIILTPWRDPRFRRYLYYVASSAACYGIVGQFIALYLLEEISLGKFLTNLYLLVIPLAVAALLGPAIGLRIARFGNRPLVFVVTLVAVPLPLMFGAAGPHSHALLASASVLAGIVTAALGVAELNMLFAMTPAAGRSAYLAAVALTGGLVGAAAPMLGGLIAQSLAGWEVTLGGVRLINLHAVFLAATALRVMHALVFVPRLPEPEARPASHLVADFLKRPGAAAESAMRRLLRR